MMERYIDSVNECNKCGKFFIIRVFDNGSYEYITKPCECESDFTPVSGELSISEIVETLRI